MISNTSVDDNEVVEIIPVKNVRPREIIDLTLDASDDETDNMNVKPTQLSYDSDSNQNNVTVQDIADGKVFEGSPKKRVRDKSPRNAPQNLLLLKRIYRNICPPTEYKPLYPDGRGAIDEPLKVYKGAKVENGREFKNISYKGSPSVCNDIYGTSSSSSSDDQDESTGKEHLLHSLHFSDVAEEMNELVDGDIISPWSNPNEEEAPELLDVAEPCSFREVLDSMEKFAEDKFAQFKKDIANHVSAELLSGTNIERLLVSKYKSVFVPDNWHGIQHIQPLHISTHCQLSLCLSNLKLDQLTLRYMRMLN
jgi:hypothetical protein